jgi:hypothetical protein
MAPHNGYSIELLRTGQLYLSIAQSIDGPHVLTQTMRHICSPSENLKSRWCVQQRRKHHSGERYSLMLSLAQGAEQVK